MTSTAHLRSLKLTAYNIRRGLGRVADLNIQHILLSLIHILKKTEKDDGMLNVSGAGGWTAKVSAADILYPTVGHAAWFD